jgi:colicin import membrane protein
MILLPSIQINDSAHQPASLGYIYLTWSLAMDTSPAIRDRIIAAADALYAESGRRNFPTVDAVRKLAKVNINDASNCMRDWRRTHAVQNDAPQLQVPEALQQTCTTAFQVLWKEAVNLSNETLRMAQAGWEAERADAEAMNEQIARACAAQEEELLAAKSAIETQAGEIMRLNELLTASQHRADVAERSVVELRTAVSHLEATSVEIRRRADDLRQALDQAHASYAAISREQTSTLNAQGGEITSLRRELEAVRQQSESSSTSARAELLAAIEEAASLRGKLDALSGVHVRNPKQSQPADEERKRRQ